MQSNSQFIHTAVWLKQKLSFLTQCYKGDLMLLSFTPLAFLLLEMIILLSRNDNNGYLLRVNKANEEVFDCSL